MWNLKDSNVHVGVFMKVCCLLILIGRILQKTSHKYKKHKITAEHK